MSVVDLEIAVNNLETVLTLFDTLKIYRSTTGAAGPYVCITTPATQLALQANKSLYEFVDANGSADYFYKTSYYSTAKAVESSLSDAFQGAGDSALSIFSVQQMKDIYLLGLDTTDTHGVEFSDSYYAFFIKSAVSWIEVELDMPLRLTAVVDEKHDFYAAEQREYLWTKLYKYPVQSVQQMRLQFPGSAPIIFPNDWLDVSNNTGVIEVIPGNSYGSDYNITPIPTGYLGGYSSYSSRKRIPSAIRVDYTAGFAPGQVPQDLVELVGQTASFGPLSTMGDIIGGAGIASQSLGIDGLSQSINTTSSPMFSGYGARLSIYEKQIALKLDVMKRKYKGIPMVIV